jgi:CheY-like chemotaxis protein
MPKLPPSDFDESGRVAKILVIDDNAIDREVLARFLRADRRREYAIEELSAVQGALERCAQWQPDCELLDH